MDSGHTSARKIVKVDEQEEPPGHGSSAGNLVSLFHPSQKLTNKTASERPRRTGLLVKVSKRSKEFISRFYQEISLAEWSDWHWQLRHTIRNAEALKQFLDLSQDEEKALSRRRASLPMRITPYYLSLLDPTNTAHALRRAVVPVSAEFVQSPGEARDPLAEDSHSPVPGIVHRYPDRVLFLATTSCLVCCRYCTRSRAVHNADEYLLNRHQWEKSLAYIQSNKQIRDVLISGGDPLELPDESLEWLLSELHKIKHVEMVRIGTKAPAVLPQRITGTLTRMLKKYHPLWISLHFTHPDELTPEVGEACARLSDAGIPLGSQTVLLRGINDDVDTLKRLFQGLLKIRVRPYYLYQCDPILGSAHFRTPVEKGLEIIQGLRGHTTGYAVPSFVIDAPNGGGKIPLLPEYVLGREGNDVILKNYEGKVFRYPDPLPEPKKS
jgi:lysine 2,3-aminomutase